MSIIKESFSETCLFLIGCIIGIILDYCILFIHKTVNILNRTDILIVMGLIQLLINAMVIIYFKNYISNLNGGKAGLGFFTMGLLSPQSLLIKKIYKTNG